VVTPGIGDCAGAIGVVHAWTLACLAVAAQLKPYEKFAEMIDANWDGIAAYCKPENKCLSVLSRGSTTRSVYSNAEHMGYVMRGISDSNGNLRQLEVGSANGGTAGTMSRSSYPRHISSWNDFPPSS